MKDINGSDDIATAMDEIGVNARAAATALAAASADARTHALRAAADALWARRDAILDANAVDLEDGRAADLTPAMLDRLALDETRIEAMGGGLRAVADQPDPVGEVLSDWTVPSGLRIRRVRTPIGVVGVIFESRPNVTADAGALCLKAGNAVILRGGSESFRSSAAIHDCLVEGLRAANLPETAIQRVPVRDRAAVSHMLRMTKAIDVIVPRGGKGLVGLVQREARVPVFAHLEGIVHIYLDAAADPEIALRVVMNAKTRRTGICGAAECLLIHESLRETIGQGVIRALIDAGIEVRAAGSLQTVNGTVPAGPDDFGREFLDGIIAVREVPSLEAAMDHIRHYGSSHTDAIVTADDAAAETFFAGLDSAILMRNASTQFADGGEFGMGAEIGIATGKLHARGPVGAPQLTTFKYLVEGDGTVRT